ncbi:hypothetical protein INT43_008626, partial [Umbelopsis isabellina]
RGCYFQYSPRLFENEEYEDFQALLGFRPPLPTVLTEQRDIEEATRLSLQMQRVAGSDESSSSASVSATRLIVRSTVISNLEEEEDFQDPIALRPRTARIAPSVTSPIQASHLLNPRSEAKSMAQQESSTPNSKRQPKVATADT